MYVWCTYMFAFSFFLSFLSFFFFFLKKCWLWSPDLILNRCLATSNVNKLLYLTQDFKNSWSFYHAVLGVLPCSPLLIVALLSLPKKVSCFQGLQATWKGLPCRGALRGVDVGLTSSGLLTSGWGCPDGGSVCCWVPPCRNLGGVCRVSSILGEIQALLEGQRPDDLVCLPLQTLHCFAFVIQLRIS